jgi:hypothetical protein
MAVLEIGNEIMAAVLSKWRRQLGIWPKSTNLGNWYFNKYVGRRRNKMSAVLLRRQLYGLLSQSPDKINRCSGV